MKKLDRFKPCKPVAHFSKQRRPTNTHSPDIWSGWVMTAHGSLSALTKAMCFDQKAVVIAVLLQTA